MCVCSLSSVQGRRSDLFVVRTGQTHLTLIDRSVVLDGWSEEGQVKSVFFLLGFVDGIYSGNKLKLLFKKV